jgi:hypothetical protein
VCHYNAQVCWAGPHTLAVAGSQDTAVRMLQLDTDDNYVLDLKNTAFPGGAASRPASAAADSAGIVALVYEPGQQVLAAATAAGRVCLFKHWLSRAHAAAAAVAAADPASQWEPSNCFWVSGTCQHKELVFCLSPACRVDCTHVGTQVCTSVPEHTGSSWRLPAQCTIVGYYLMLATKCCACSTVMMFNPADIWQRCMLPWQVGGAPEKLSWGPTAQIVAAGCADGLYLCVKSPLHHKLSDGYAAVQVGRHDCCCLWVTCLKGAAPASRGCQCNSKAACLHTYACALLA